MFYGLDLHKEFIQVACLTKDGQKSRLWKIPTSKESIEDFAKNLEKDAQVVMETTFNTWQVHDLIKKQFCGRVIVANALQVKAIASARVKTDKVDATMLAQLLRCNFIPEVTLPDQKSWEIRQLISHRKLLSKQKTSLTNGLKAILNHKLLKFPRDLTSPSGRQWLKDQEFSELERVIVENSLQTIQCLEQQLQSADEQLRKMASWDESVRLLLTVPGIGIQTAMAVLSAIGDIKRFDRPEKLASYFGLVPSVSQSASKCHYGSITKAGNHIVRWLLIEAANQLALSGSPMTASYYRIRKKKGHQKAVVALARKLSEVIWHILNQKKPYRYAAVTAYLKNKLRKVMPGLPQPKPGQAATSLKELCDYVQLPPPETGSKSEIKTSRRNRTEVNRHRIFFGTTELIRGEKAMKTGTYKRS